MRPKRIGAVTLAALALAGLTAASCGSREPTAEEIAAMSPAERAEYEHRRLQERADQLADEADERADQIDEQARDLRHQADQMADQADRVRERGELEADALVDRKQR
jgi:Skp family chaperone for outer membrane proteins